MGTHHVSNRHFALVADACFPECMAIAHHLKVHTLLYDRHRPLAVCAAEMKARDLLFACSMGAHGAWLQGHQLPDSDFFSGSDADLDTSCYDSDDSAATSQPSTEYSQGLDPLELRSTAESKPPQGHAGRPKRKRRALPNITLQRCDRSCNESDGSVVVPDQIRMRMCNDLATKKMRMCHDFATQKRRLCNDLATQKCCIRRSPW